MNPEGGEYVENDIFEKLYTAYYMKVYSYLLSLSCDSNTAEELTEEAFFKAFTSNAGFKERSEESTWLCAIAKNLYIDLLRKNKKYEEIDEKCDSGVNIAEAYADKDLSFRIHIALHSLNEPYREVFELRVFGELSFSEIGTVFGKTESWARVTYHRAKLQIQERMG